MNLLELAVLFIVIVPLGVYLSAKFGTIGHLIGVMRFQQIQELLVSRQIQSLKETADGESARPGQGKAGAGVGPA